MAFNVTFSKQYLAVCYGWSKFLNYYEIHVHVWQLIQMEQDLCKSGIFKHTMTKKILQLPWSITRDYPTSCPFSSYLRYITWINRYMTHAIPYTWQLIYYRTITYYTYPAPIFQESCDAEKSIADPTYVDYIMPDCTIRIQIV